MRSRLAVVSSLLVAAWIAACGGSDSTPETAPVPDGGTDGTTSNQEASTDGATDGAVAPSACDTQAAALCGARKCDVNLGCVQCVANTDCTGQDKFCVRGRCEACATHADCGVAAPVCSPVDNRCHVSCVGDGAAPCKGDTPICDTASGACVGCQTAATCPAGAPLCEPTTKTCVQCTVNSECPAAKPRCFLGDFTCVECSTSADCAGGKVCDPREKRCIATCANDTQCAAPTPKCNTTAASCVQCLATPDCAGVANRPLCDTTKDRCVECISATDCNADAGTPICDNDRCVQCKDDKDCPGVDPKCNNGTCK